jgi:hypothetical protein
LLLFVASRYSSDAGVLQRDRAWAPCSGKPTDRVPSEEEAPAGGGGEGGLKKGGERRREEKEQKRPLHGVIPRDQLAATLSG